jgi:acetyltransferase-like isoleucine patch superfamily enzyme
LAKFGAIVGDKCEIGCNVVLNPGSIVGKNSVIYPGVSFRGVLPANKICKLLQ